MCLVMRLYVHVFGDVVVCNMCLVMWLYTTCVLFGDVVVCTCVVMTA